MKNVLSTAKESLRLLEVISTKNARKKSHALVTKPLKKVKRLAQSALGDEEVSELREELKKLQARVNALEIEVLGHRAPQIVAALSRSEPAPPVFPNI